MSVDSIILKDVKETCFNSTMHLIADKKFFNKETSSLFNLQLFFNKMTDEKSHSLGLKDKHAQLKLPQKKKPTKTYRGCLTSQLLDKNTYQGQAKTHGQKWELTRSEAQEMLNEMHHLPVCWEHNQEKQLGRIVGSQITDDNKWEVEFEIDPGHDWLNKVLDSKLNLELSLAHWQKVRKPIEVSICKIGSRAGSVIYSGSNSSADSQHRDKFSKIQTNCNAENESKLRRFDTGQDILIQASAEQFLQQISTRSTKMNTDNQSSQMNDHPMQSQQSNISNDNSLNHKADRPTMPPDTYDPSKAKGTTIQTNGDVKLHQELSEKINGVEFGQFIDAMNDMMTTPSLAKDKKKILHESVMQLIAESRNGKESNNETLEQLKQENAELKKKNEQSSQYYNDQINKMCEALVSMPGGDWDACQRTALKEMAAKGGLDDLYNSVGPNLIKCSMFINNQMQLMQQAEDLTKQSNSTNQQSSGSHQDFGQQLARFLDTYKNDSYQQSTKNLVNARQSYQPVKCSLGRTHSEMSSHQSNTPQSQEQDHRQSIPDALRVYNDRMVAKLMASGARGLDNYETPSNHLAKRQRNF